MLLYIKSEDGVGKSQVIQVLEMRFIFLNRQKELVISILTDCAADNIRGNTIYIILEINTRIEKDFIIKTNTLWLQRLSFVIDKISIINIKLFILIDRQLQRAKILDMSSTLIFGRLFLIVLMGDFYQFASVIEKVL